MNTIDLGITIGVDVDILGRWNIVDVFWSCQSNKRLQYHQENLSDFCRMYFLKDFSHVPHETISKDDDLFYSLMLSVE